MTVRQVVSNSVCIAGFIVGAVIRAPGMRAQDVRQAPKQVLAVGASIDGSLEAGPPRVYEVRAGAGDYFRILTRPHGSPLSVQLSAPSGTLVSTVTNQAGQSRTIAISMTATEAGFYGVRLSLTDADAPIRDYTLTLAEQRPARVGDATRIQAEHVRESAKTLQIKGIKEALQQAVEQFDAEIALWQELDDKLEEGRALDAKGDTYLSLGQTGKAAECFERAVILASSARRCRRAGKHYQQPWRSGGLLGQMG